MTVTARAPGDLLTAAIFNTKLEAPILAAELGADSVTAVAIAAGAVGASERAPIPAARLRLSASVTLPHNTMTTISWDTEDFDNLGLHSPSVNPSRLTAPIAGLYVASSVARFTNNSTGYRYGQLLKNGVLDTILFAIPPAVGDDASVSVTIPVYLAAGDYLEMQLYQNSGISLSALAANGCRFGIWWVTT